MSLYPILVFCGCFGMLSMSNSIISYLLFIKIMSFKYEVHDSFFNLSYSLEF